MGAMDMLKSDQNSIKVARKLQVSRWTLNPETSRAVQIFDKIIALALVFTALITP